MYHRPIPDRSSLSEQRKAKVSRLATPTSSLRRRCDHLERVSTLELPIRFEILRPVRSLPRLRAVISPIFARTRSEFSTRTQFPNVGNFETRAFLRARRESTFRRSDERARSLLIFPKSPRSRDRSSFASKRSSVGKVSRDTIGGRSVLDILHAG